MLHNIPLQLLACGQLLHSDIYKSVYKIKIGDINIRVLIRDIHNFVDSVWSSNRIDQATDPCCLVL